MFVRVKPQDLWDLNQQPAGKMVRSIYNSTISTREARASNRKARDNFVDPGTDSTTRITNSANSSFSPPIEDGRPTIRRNSSSGKKRKAIQQRLQFGRDSLKKLRREGKSSVNSARMVGKQRNSDVKRLKEK